MFIYVHKIHLSHKHCRLQGISGPVEDLGLRSRVLRSTSGPGDHAYMKNHVCIVLLYTCHVNLTKRAQVA